MPRIVAGRLRGRRFAVPASGTRATSDMVREGVFATLGSLLGGLEGRQVLDLYAGSGAVGLEAWSRGAARVVLVESAPRALRVLRDNVATLAAGVSEVQVLAMKAEGAAAALTGPGLDPPTFDVVFADPPYDLPASRLAAVLVSLGDAGLVATGAVVAVERRSREAWEWPPGIEPLRERRYGDTTVWYGLW
jgi:16S rRNA (guanine966-N2)-methyltransferase